MSRAGSSRRTAPSPIGPWSESEIVHTCKDAYGDQRLYSYAGKAQSEPVVGRQAGSRYLTSSVDTWQVATDPRLFWPKFVSVGMREARPESVGTVARGSQPDGE